MNELSLSNDLKVVEEEIFSFFELGKKSFWEIGKRLKHIKENDLTHGNFMNWCETKLSISSKQVNKYIAVYEKFPNWKSTPNLGLENMYLIATLPEEQKQEQMQKIEQGEQPTVRELQSLKKQLKQKDEIINELSNQEPQTVTKVVEKEVFPNDYHEIKTKVHQLQTTNQRLIEEHQKLLREKEEVNEKSIKYDELNEAIQASQGQLNQTQKKISEYNDLHKLLKESNSFLSKASALVYSDLSSLAQSDPLVQQELNQLLNNLNRFTRDINDLLSQKIILEGEIIND
ncbi:DUF3102 domain-containing protein [Facklamia sp. P12945]|uniref:DUF3102 domain-containing protein n=1 Tax=Facklamia sp. P12945 TaxID=3421950 RepID=UPI003D16709E